MNQTATVMIRERFLVDVSAYLDTRCQPLANECRYQAAALNKVSGKDLDLAKLQCSACGSLAVHEQAVDMVKKSRTMKGSKLQLLKCQSCTRTTKRHIETEAPEKLRSNIKVRTDKIPANASKAPEAQIVGKTSGKKRAKERKNQGLQAMLEKSSEPAPKSSFGLLDFMSKQG